MLINYIRSDKDTHFTGALAQDAVEHENISLGNALVGVNECLIEGVSLLSDENLEWDVFFWTKDTNANADLDLDTFLDYVNFPAKFGKQLGGSGAYYYSATNLGIPYRDDDGSEKLHISLCNRSTASKTAGANGEVVIVVMLRALMFS